MLGPTTHIALPLRSYVNHVRKTMSPWCVTFTPQPFSLSAGALYQRSVKLRAAPGEPPRAHVGAVPNGWRMMDLDWVTGPLAVLTVYVMVPVSASVKLKLIVPMAAPA